MSIIIYCLLSAWLHTSWLPAPKSATPVATAELPAVLKNDNAIITSLYEMMNLRQMGLSKHAFESAYQGYMVMVKKKLINRQAYLSICDFSQSSNNKRFYVLDLATNEVLINTYVAHGRKSGGEYATRFSNKPRSNQSSLGFFKTQNSYHGEHGLSLRLKGLETGINDKAGPRAIVMHGAEYVGNEWLERNSYMGRSYGCPAIPKTVSKAVINTIKDGSCLFIYYPSKTYLKSSKILNG